MRYEFEYEDEQGGWSPLGIGEGSGDDAVFDALTDVRDGETLAVGRYRCRPDDGVTGTWWLFYVDAEGRISPAAA